MHRSKKPSIAAIIEALSTQKDEANFARWKDLEDHVQHVYQTLLNLKGERVLVARDVVVLGQQDQSHQIDVYYEFELTGLRHRVAIECKNTKRPLDKDRVMAFVAKIKDCPGMRGCIVTVNGYQKGAKKFAEDNGITALSFCDLPSIGRLLAMRLQLAAIPTEDTIGQPFWTIFELETGAPVSHHQDGETYGLLFFSRKQAQTFYEVRSFGSGWAVRGLSQENFRVYILTVDAMGGRYLLAESIQVNDNLTEFACQEITRQKLLSEFYIGSNTIPEEPMVMPSIAAAKANKK